MPNSSEFPQVRLSIESGLVSPGDTIMVQDKVDVTSFAIGGRQLELEDGIEFDVMLTNTGDGILASGVARMSASTSCDRCLGDAHLDVEAEISCYYLHTEPDGEVDDEEDFGLIDASNGTIDLAEPIQGGLAMEVPYVVLCDEDCKGLCTVCGANLNEVDCGCVVEHDPDFDRPNPFAALAALKFDDDLEPVEISEDPEESEEDDMDDEEFERAWDERSEGAQE